VVRGLGYSVLPVHALQREIEAEQVRSWPLEPALTRIVHLVLPTTRPLPTQPGPWTLCRVILRDLVRSGDWHAAQMRVSV
jgi:LysR family transcriptional regulator, nitrogen assimilation regulatory protein